MTLEKVAEELTRRLFPTRKDNASILNREIVQLRSRRKPLILTALQQVEKEKETEMQFLIDGIVEQRVERIENLENAIQAIHIQCSDKTSEANRITVIGSFAGSLVAQIQKARADGE